MIDFDKELDDIIYTDIQGYIDDDQVQEDARKAGIAKIKQLVLKLVKECKPEEESRIKYGAIRCARCMAIPDMPRQKHCVDWVNDAIDQYQQNLEERIK